MPITIEALRKLVIKEIKNSQSVLIESPLDSIVGQEQTGDHDKDPSEYGAEKARRSLYHMGAQAQQLHDMLQVDDKMDPEVEADIAKSAELLEKVFKVLTYSKQHPEGR